MLLKSIKALRERCEFRLQIDSDLRTIRCALSVRIGREYFARLPLLRRGTSTADLCMIRLLVSTQAVPFSGTPEQFKAATKSGPNGFGYYLRKPGRETADGLCSGLFAVFNEFSND